MMTILVVDDYTLVRESLCAQLTQCPEIGSVIQAANSSQAIEKVSIFHPDIVLLDIDTPGKNIRSTIHAIRETAPGTHIILISGHDYDSYIEIAIDTQVQGYILKQEGLDVLREAMHRVSQGGKYFCKAIMNRLNIQDGRLRIATPRNAAIAALTQRERELLVHLGEGASLKEAASYMQVSYKTADNQKASLMRKLDIHDRVELARFAIREGIVSVA